MEAAPRDEVWDATDDAVAGVAVEEAVLVGQNQSLVAVAAPMDAHCEAAALWASITWPTLHSVNRHDPASLATASRLLEEHQQAASDALQPTWETALSQQGV